MIDKKRIQNDLVKAAEVQNVSVKELINRLCSVASNSTKAAFTGKPAACLAWQVLQYIDSTGLDFFRDVLGEEVRETSVISYDITPKQLSEVNIKNLVSSFYDAQKLRIQMGNRLCQLATKDGEDDNSVLETMATEYTLINDGNRLTMRYLHKRINDLNGKLKCIKTCSDYFMYESYMNMTNVEDQLLQAITQEVKNHPLWNAFFKDVKGCGPIMAAVIISKVDIRKCGHVSSLWRYAGLDTVTVTDADGTVHSVGRNRSCLVDGYYFDKNGAVQTKKSLGYNPELKSKLIGVLGSCMLKAGLRTAKDENGNPILDANGKKIQTASSPYVQCYLDYMNRLNQRSDTANINAAHKMSMGVRYMIKQFLRDLYVVWRDLEGLPISQPYEVEKLGNRPHKYNEKQVEMANI